MVPTLCVGIAVRDALRRRTLPKPQRTQSVLGCAPTRSVGTIIICEFPGFALLYPGYLLGFVAFGREFGIGLLGVGFE